MFGKAANMFVYIKENAYARRKQTQHEFRDEYETELAGRVGAAGAKIISAFGRKSGTQSQNAGASAPPPIPVVSYYVAMFGQTAGPYDKATLKNMAREGGLKPDSLVWKEGMENWVEASSVEELRNLFSEDSDKPSIPPIPSV